MLCSEVLQQIDLDLRYLDGQDLRCGQRSSSGELAELQEDGKARASHQIRRRCYVCNCTDGS